MFKTDENTCLSLHELPSSISSTAVSMMGIHGCVSYTVKPCNKGTPPPPLIIEAEVRVANPYPARCELWSNLYHLF